MANEHHSLATYVSDMLALERHIRIPFDTQRGDNDVMKYEAAASLTSRLASLSDQHVDALKACLERLGGHEASPIKSAVAEFEGFFAGAIDKMRKTKVSKALRDDYTALALCTASYTALIATANALGDASIASLAERHLQDYAQLIMQIGDALPGVVVQELRDTGLDVNTTTIATSRGTIEGSWSSAQAER
jgi:ferritin-like metal-binding protein YciE